MPDPASLPERLADAEGELPEEIVKAISGLEVAAHALGGNFASMQDADCADRAACEARSALTATILARLAAAESAREAAERHAAWLKDWAVTATANMDEAEAQRDAALARAEGAEKALEDLKGSFHEDSDAYAKISAALAHPATAEET